MFFQKKEKSTLEVKVITIPSQMLCAGCSVDTTEQKMFKDASSLAKKYASIKSQILDRENPFRSVVITFTKKPDGVFHYFMGDCVNTFTNLSDTIETFILPQNSLYARLSVAARSEVTCTYDIAKGRQYFHTDWLPSSTYELDDSIQMEDLELYDVRSKLKSPTIDLYFPIKEK